MNKESKMTYDSMLAAVCPACRSENTKLIEKRESNGIMGPDYASWVVDSYYSCQSCGCRFDKVNGS